MAKYFDVEQKYPWEMPELLMNGEGLNRITEDMAPADEAFLRMFGIDGFTDDEYNADLEEEIMADRDMSMGQQEWIAEIIKKYYRNQKDKSKLTKKEIRALRYHFHQLEFKKIEMTTTAQEDASWEELFGKDD